MMLALIESLTNIIKNIIDIKNKLTAKNAANKKDGFYYEEYTKHLTIYKNGHGILMYSFTLRITDSKKCTTIYRKINCEDASRDFRFDTLSNMQKTNIDERFNKMGFWYESDNKFISSACEFNWDDDNPERQKNIVNPKQLKWIFKINNSILENGNKYKFNYILSLPDMFPITNYEYDHLKEPYADYEFVSLFNSDNKVKNVTYILSFERGFNLTQTPKCAYYIKGNASRTNLKVNRENNFIYQKYIARYKNLSYNNNIEYVWDIRT